MDTVQTAAPPIQTAPALTAVPDMSAPVVVPPTPVASPVAPPSYSSPTMPNTGKFDVMRDINWIETLLLGLSAGALAYIISYYRYKMMESKVINFDVQRQFDNMNVRVGNLETDMTKIRPQQGNYM